MDKDIDLEDIDSDIEELKKKAPGMTGFTNEFYIEFQENLRIWILQYIYYTREIENPSSLQRQGAVTLIPRGQKEKRELGN